MAHSPHPPASLLYQRIDTFQALRSRIDRAFAAGQITPQRRRDLLAAARDRSGVPLGRLSENKLPSVKESQSEFRNRQNENDKRYRERQAAKRSQTSTPKA